MDMETANAIGRRKAAIARVFVSEENKKMKEGLHKSARSDCPISSFFRVR